MSHCINMYLIEKSYLHTEESKKILNKYVELPYDLIPFSEEEKDIISENLKENESFLYVETDYFGGIGHQSSLVYTKNDGHITHIDYKTINKALSFYGIPNSFDTDEFDMINLGRFREDDDFLIETVRFQGYVDINDEDINISISEEHTQITQLGDFEETYNKNDMFNAYEAGKRRSGYETFEQFIKKYKVNN